MSISPTFFEQLLRQNPFAIKLQTQIVSTYKLRKKHSYEKAARKILVKLTPECLETDLGLYQFRQCACQRLATNLESGAPLILALTLHSIIRHGKKSQKNTTLFWFRDLEEIFKFKVV